MSDTDEAAAPEPAATPAKKKKKKYQPPPGYRVIAKIGSGSMGVIYKAIQVSLDRPVAVKLLHPRLARREGFAERFVKEARIQAKLNHPNIVSAYDVGYHDGLYYFVMEFVDGRTVQSLLDRGGSLDERRALGIAHQMAQALGHAHEHHMVHRDVKPANIMLTKSGMAKLCDLGFALVRRSADEGDDGVLGTPTYVSPEQARGDKDIDIRSDIYSLGATLYHMLVGRPPFEGPDAASVIGKHLTERPVPPIHANNHLAPESSRLVERMLEKRRENRFQSPRELVKEIDLVMRVVAGEVVAGARRGEGGGVRRAPDTAVGRRPSESSIRKPSESQLRRAAAAAGVPASASDIAQGGATTIANADSQRAAASSRPHAPAPPPLPSAAAGAGHAAPAPAAEPDAAPPVPPGRPLRPRSRLRGYVRIARRR